MHINRLTIEHSNIHKKTAKDTYTVHATTTVTFSAYETTLNMTTNNKTFMVISYKQ